MTITKQLIYNTFEIDKLKQIKEQLEQENNQQLLKIVNRRLSYNRWEVVVIEFGTPETDLEEKNYQKNEIINNLHGVNLGFELSKQHYGIILTPFFLNRHIITVIPITSRYTDEGIEKYKCDYDNIVCLDENNYKFLRKPSVALINQIKTVDIKRVCRLKNSRGKEFIFQINNEDRKIITKKSLSIFFGDTIENYKLK